LKVEQSNGTIENHIAAAMEQHGTKQWTKLLPLIAYNLNTSKPSSTKIMPYRVVFNKLPNLGNKKNFIEIDKDGKEAPIEEEEPTNNEVVEEREEEVEELREGGEGEEGEEGEEEEIDENLLELREQLNKNMDKNAAMMIKKHDHKRNKTTREFIINDNVSVSIPRIDRGGTDLRRLPGKVNKISEGLNKFYTVLTVWGILKDKYRSTSLEPFSGIVEVNLEDSREISLNEAATLQKERVIFFDSNKCNFLKHSKLVKFSQITLLNVNAQNEKIIFCLKIFKFNLKLWILKKEKN
jgi:hypothetical protein